MFGMFNFDHNRWDPNDAMIAALSVKASKFDDQTLTLLTDCSVIRQFEEYQSNFWLYRLQLAFQLARDEEDFSVEISDFWTVEQLSPARVQLNPMMYPTDHLNTGESRRV